MGYLVRPPISSMSGISIPPALKHLYRKDFDKMFSAQQIADCRIDYMEGSKVGVCPYRYVQPKLADVNFAVYRHRTHLSWQLFRVSLKGLSTVQKLHALYKRW